MKNFTMLFILFVLLLNTAVTAADFKYGDADSDNILTASDAALILKKVLMRDYPLAIENKIDNYMKFLDVDKDNILTAVDCAIVLQKALNSDYKMPCEIIDVTETSTETSTESISYVVTETSSEMTSENLDIQISVGGKTFNAVMYDNPAAREFINQLPMTLNMNELNGNEKYFYMDTKYSANSQNVDFINAGDLMLYGNNCIVLFYESFDTSYRYTPLGRIDNPNGLASALGTGSVNVTFSKK